MSKRKRVFDRGNSYRDTGIPCGNPKRVQTGEVMCMPGPTAVTLTGQQLQGENMETEGEKQLRTMAQRQLKTDISMQDVLSQQRHFTEAGQYKPITKDIRGMMGLQEYQDVARGDQRVETLRQCGLTDNEIRIKLNKEGMDKGLDPAVKIKSTLGVNPDVQESQLHAIEAKLAEKEASLGGPETFRGLKEVSRQEMDIEKSMFWGTDRDSNSLTSLLIEKNSVTGDPHDPINHLPQLMADIEERAREKIMEKRRRRRRNRRRGNKDGADNCVDDVSRDSEGQDEDGGVIGCLTLEEMMALKQSENLSHSAEEKSDTSNVADVLSNSASTSGLGDRDSNADTHNSVNLPAVSNQTDHSSNRDQKANEGGNVSGSAAESARKVLRGPVEFLPAEHIEKHRLSAEDIKQLPKFANYEPGSPSSILYVKNLSSRISERDLVSLFGRYQNEAGSEVVYRLMTGRMRGQAFIYFCNSEVASQALELVNGFVLHGKPIIVQYGKRTAA